MSFTLPNIGNPDAPGYLAMTRRCRGCNKKSPKPLGEKYYCGKRECQALKAYDSRG